MILSLCTLVFFVFFPGMRRMCNLHMYFLRLSECSTKAWIFSFKLLFFPLRGCLFVCLVVVVFVFMHLDLDA